MLDAPRFWRCFVAHFGIDDAASRRWWEAVCAAQEPNAVAWRRAMLACDDVESVSPAAVRAFLHLRVPPAQIVDLIEMLVDEGQLSRRRASAIEYKVLG
jgi:hypothetical protein